MFRKPLPPADYPPFSRLPARLIAAGPAGHRLAVHVAGNLANSPMPLLCLAGYQRNMLDFLDFLPMFQPLSDDRQAVVLVDLAGRGRSAWRDRKTPYSTLSDADDVLAVLDALAIEKAIVLGQGHGGQVAMAMAMHRPGALGAAVLIDAGPVADPRGLVRLRNNLRHILAIRGEKHARAGLRKILAADYPGESEARLDALAERSFWFTRRGHARGLYDPRLIDQLDAFDFDDILEPQWALFDCFAFIPLLLMRTQLSDQLRRETFEEMGRRRSDAITQTIAGQGYPALLDRIDEVGAIADFVRHVTRDTSGAD